MLSPSRLAENKLHFYLLPDRSGLCTVIKIMQHIRTEPSSYSLHNYMSGFLPTENELYFHSHPERSGLYTAIKIYAEFPDQRKTIAASPFLY